MDDDFERYPYRYRDATTGAWRRARRRRTLAQIRTRHVEWELIGPVASATTLQCSFAALTRSTMQGSAHAELDIQPHEAMPAAIDRLEADLVGCFLRRYVTYCARRGRFGAMQGAARLMVQVEDALA
jgi:hypothetical protein